jgi:hypothetical protein
MQRSVSRLAIILLCYMCSNSIISAIDVHFFIGGVTFRVEKNAPASPLTPSPA